MCHELTSRPIDFVRRLSKKIQQVIDRRDGIGAGREYRAENVNYNKRELEKLGMANRATFILAKRDDPSLSENSIDLVFLCNAYHHVEHHVDYRTKIKSALKPNGRILIVDFYHDERSGKLGFSKHHLVPRERAISNMEKAGFTFSKEHPFLPRQYFLEFVKVQ